MNMLSMRSIMPLNGSNWQMVQLEKGMDSFLRSCKGSLETPSPPRGGQVLPLVATRKFKLQIPGLIIKVMALGNSLAFLELQFLFFPFLLVIEGTNSEIGWQSRGLWLDLVSGSILVDQYSTLFGFVSFHS